MDACAAVQVKELCNARQEKQSWRARMHADCSRERMATRGTTVNHSIIIMQALTVASRQTTTPPGTIVMRRVCTAATGRPPHVIPAGMDRRRTTGIEQCRAGEMLEDPEAEEREAWQLARRPSLRKSSSSSAAEIAGGHVQRRVLLWFLQRGCRLDLWWSIHPPTSPSRVGVHAW